MEPNADRAARLAQLDARRRAAVPPTGTAVRRRHPAHRSRVAVTVASVLGMAGLSGAMALSDQAVSAGPSIVGTSATASKSSLSSALTGATSGVASATPNTVSKGS